VQAHTGHQQPSSVQGYYDTSVHMKKIAARATAVPVSEASSSSSSSSSSSAGGSLLGKRAASDNQMAPVYNIQLTITGDVVGSLSMFEK
jgi:hypothetical protein